MTDAEIVKALECCVTKEDCDGCPYDEINDCIKGHEEDILDLIKRQKAENERLKTNLNIELENYATEYDNKIKAEAYREFAERSEKELFIKQNEHREHWMETLNRHRCTEAYKDHEWSIDNWLRGYGEAVQDILAINQNFLKELVGDDDG